jgi:hypothetical protein
MNVSGFKLKVVSKGFVWTTCSISFCSSIKISNSYGLAIEALINIVKICNTIHDEIVLRTLEEHAEWAKGMLEVCMLEEIII